MKLILHWRQSNSDSTIKKCSTIGRFNVKHKTTIRMPMDLMPVGSISTMQAFKKASVFSFRARGVNAITCLLTGNDAEIICPICECTWGIRTAYTSLMVI